ncbi:MAG: flagellar basal body L-ring protein FlgH [Novosphingobium sp.]
MTGPAPLPLSVPAWPLSVPDWRRPGRKPAPPCQPGPRRAPLLATSIIAATALAASPVLAKPKPRSGFEATLPLPPAAPRVADGSIFNVASGYAPLHGGTRAHTVGDALTIVLVENTTAAKTVGSQSQKNGGLSLTPPKAGPLSVNPDALKLSSDSVFKGSGNASQTSILSGTLSVTIAEVRANGTALVRGEKRMLLSQGDEWIQVSGIVRLADIDQNNAIPSSRVADARIEYSGKGALQRASRQGWLGRFFNMISPF